MCCFISPGTGSQVHGHDQVRPILDDTHLVTKYIIVDFPTAKIMMLDFIIPIFSTPFCSWISIHPLTGTPEQEEGSRW
jgi:hypothetical protein